MADPKDILADALRRASDHVSDPIIDAEIASRVAYIARHWIGAPVRMILAATLAGVHNPEVDVRKPFKKKMKTPDSYSGRNYDAKYITEFINEHQLPCNPTEGFLTSAFRAKSMVLTPDVDLGGRDPEVYQTALQLLADVREDRVSAGDLLAETIRVLLIMREENQDRLESLLKALRETEAMGVLPLSAEALVKLIQQHMGSPNSSRLPVLVVAAAYHSAAEHLGERVLALQSHNAADEQTGALGDVEITLLNDDHVITSYEMKMRRVTRDDIDRALQKIAHYEHRVAHYVFITTEEIEEQVKIYAAQQYARTGGTEIVVLDCIGFLRHFLHLFHRLRLQFLEAYQELVLAEPESAVRQELKETFLTLRRAAETGMVDTGT